MFRKLKCKLFGHEYENIYVLLVWNGESEKYTAIYKDRCWRCKKVFFDSLDLEFGNIFTKEKFKNKGAYIKSEGVYVLMYP